MASPEDMGRALASSMHERTGRRLDEWVELVETTSGIDPLDQLNVRRWLRDVHELPQNTQWAIAFEVAGRHGWTMPSADEFADVMYSGKKQTLRPLHDQVVALAAAAGPDARVEGRATYTPIVHHRQFAAVAPGPRGTLRVGLRFREVPTDERLAPSKGFAQSTHWTHLAPDDDPTWLAELLAEAYRQN